MRKNYNYYLLVFISIFCINTLISCNQTNAPIKKEAAKLTDKQENDDSISTRLMGQAILIQELCKSSNDNKYCEFLSKNNYSKCIKVSLTNNSGFDYKFISCDSLFLITSHSMRLSNGTWEEKFISFNKPNTFPNAKGITVNAKATVHFYLAYPSDDIDIFSLEAGGLDGGNNIWKPVVLNLILKNGEPVDINCLISDRKPIP